MRKVKIYTDGACSGNPGPGGWAAVIIKDNFYHEISGFYPMTTNQQMELTAAIKALEFLEEEKSQVVVVSDSAYLVNCFKERWYERWRRNGWKNARNHLVENKELWERLLYFAEKIHEVSFVKTKGHSTNKYNNRCDQLARAEIKKTLCQIQDKNNSPRGT